MNKLPCKNCITFAMCKSKYRLKEYNNKTFYLSLNIITCPMVIKFLDENFEKRFLSLLKIYCIEKYTKETMILIRNGWRECIDNRKNSM